MIRTIGFPGTVMAAALLALTLAACGSPRPVSPARRLAATAQPIPPAAEQEQSSTADAGPSTRPVEEATGAVRQRAREARERERKRTKLERSLEVAQLNLAKAQIAVELGDLKYNDQISHAEMEFELAKRRQQIFTKFTAPARLARGELSLQQAEDAVLEAREDLGQLERAHGAAQSGEEGKESAIERTKRRLQRLEHDLELRRVEHTTLKEVTLPLEQSELDLAAEHKKRAVLQVQRDNEGALIDRRIAVLNAEAEVARLENELADLREETGEDL
jgi:hypothetical protein